MVIALSQPKEKLKLLALDAKKLFFFVADVSDK
jgi:hypothetical protein